AAPALASAPRARAALRGPQPGHPRAGGPGAGSEANALPSRGDRARGRLRGGGQAHLGGERSAGRRGRVRSVPGVAPFQRKDPSTKVLVTGITGFAGSHLVASILTEKEGVEAVGIQRWRTRTENAEPC